MGRFQVPLSLAIPSGVLLGLLGGKVLFEALGLDRPLLRASIAVAAAYAGLAIRWFLLARGDRTEDSVER